MGEYVCEVVDRPAEAPIMILAKRERVVRCRDCKHWRKPTDRERSRCTGAMAFVEPTPDGFCAWGKPRGRDTDD